MAQRTYVELVSDISGEAHDPDNGVHVETYRFGQGKFAYEVDLTEKEGEVLMTTLDEYVEVARKLGPLASAPGGGGRTARPRSSTATRDREQSRSIRDWARRHEFEVSSRGRIPNEIVEAYDEAHDR